MNSMKLLKIFFLKVVMSRNLLDIYVIEEAPSSEILVSIQWSARRDKTEQSNTVDSVLQTSAFTGIL